MNNYRRFAAVLIIFELILIIVCNVLLLRTSETASDGSRFVDIKRASNEIREGTEPDKIDLDKYKSIIKISGFSPNEKSNNEYTVEEINGTLYRFEYRHKGRGYILTVNLVIGVFFIISVVTVLFIGRKVIYPFHSINYLAWELAKGNMSVPLKAEKSRFFGKFLWGMDMLRETLEQGRLRELELVKEKKTILLSISHDVKTPLAAIGLYIKALKEDLYNSEEKKQEIIFGIEKNTEEIKKYVDEIVKASREGFLSLETENVEFYLQDVIRKITKYYADKAKIYHTDFIVENADDCLLYGDEDRVVEVMQNVIENAFKYGDGRKISVTFEEEEDCKLVIVANTGRGPMPEEMPHIFDSFYRGGNSKGKSGSGLGLYICSQLLGKMDGDIFAKSGDDSFYVTLVLKKV